MYDKNENEQQRAPTITDLHIRLAVAIEQLRHLTTKVDERYETIKRLHDRMDSTDKMKEDIAELKVYISQLQSQIKSFSETKESQISFKVRIDLLEKLVYTSLGMGTVGVFTLLWSLIQKFL
jgi:two-component sensor histidine kinase